MESNLGLYIYGSYFEIQECECHGQTLDFKHLGLKGVFLINFISSDNLGKN